MNAMCLHMGARPNFFQGDTTVCTERILHSSVRQKCQLIINKKSLWCFVQKEHVHKSHLFEFQEMGPALLALLLLQTSTSFSSTLVHVCRKQMRMLIQKMIRVDQWIGRNFQDENSRLSPVESALHFCAMAICRLTSLSLGSGSVTCRIQYPDHLFTSRCLSSYVHC